MKIVLYTVLKGLIRFGFFSYFKEIRMKHLERVPRDRAVMLLSNHQNALLDALLYAAFAEARKPYFLTRSDVFRNPVLGWVFKGLRMIPIYRMRDGRNTLHQNQQIFDQCADLFSRGEHILLFPEANHNLKRQVRPLSKGFTRILAYSFQKYPELDIWIVPVGVNYQCASGFPDRAAHYFGEAFSAREFWSEADRSIDVPEIKERVFQAITQLTTHIPPGEDYDARMGQLCQSGADLTDPDATRAILLSGPVPEGVARAEKVAGNTFWKGVFRFLNAPVWLPWKRIAEKVVPEPEFMSTFRFLYSLFAFLIYYAALGWLLGYLTNASWALTGVVLWYVHNLAYVKLQRVNECF